LFYFSQCEGKIFQKKTAPFSVQSLINRITNVQPIFVCPNQSTAMQTAEVVASSPACTKQFILAVLLFANYHLSNSKYFCLRVVSPCSLPKGTRGIENVVASEQQ
jgi:hypothetical protein